MSLAGCFTGIGPTPTSLTTANGKRAKYDVVLFIETRHVVGRRRRDDEHKKGAVPRQVRNGGKEGESPACVDSFRVTDHKQMKMQ